MDGIRVYRIPAAKDRGKSLLEDLKIKLSGAVGDKKAAALYNALDTTGSFGGFGRFNVEVEFHYPRQDSDDARESFVKYSYIGPSSGEVALTREITVDQFKEQFGGAITVPDAPPMPPEPVEEALPADPEDQAAESATEAAQ